MKKCSLLFFLLSSLVYAYQWPLSPFSGPHPINAVLGEFRVPYGNLSYHFHSGVDIGRGTNTPVYSITNGVASIEYDNQGNVKHFVKVGNYRYVHIIPSVANDAPVTAFVTIIGYIDGENHLHFEEYSGATKLNPLASLDNYADNSIPTVWKPSFWHQSYDAQGNATNTSIPKSGLWGKIDIRARAKDAQSNGSPRVGMYSMGYVVQDKDGNIYLYKEDIVFNEIVGRIENGIGYIYDKPNCNNSLYYYWLTNKFLYTSNNAEDRYWNTKLRKGEEWDGEDARINAEAEYPDGKYWIWAFGTDIKGNGADFSHLSGADTSVVNIDNFVPYIQSVEIKQGDTLRYSAHWPTIPVSNTDLGKLEIEENSGVFIGTKGFTMKLKFSEVMDISKTPDVNDVKILVGREKIIPFSVEWESDTILVADFNKISRDIREGTATLNFSGAEDMVSWAGAWKEELKV